MKTTATTLAISACMMLASPAVFASLLPGSTIKDWPTNAARHTITITRTAANDAEKKMIEAAETAAPSATNTWWDGEQNNIKIAFALTKDALAYYEGLVQGYQKKTWKTYIEPSSKLEYAATVKHHDSYGIIGKTYKDVYVVTLKLMFNADFTESGTTGIVVNKERTVVVDAQGKVLAVSGDGKTEAPMIAI